MAGHIDVRLLGGVEVHNGEAAVPVAGAKLKAILVMLALGAPHPVSAERLIEEIWSDEAVTNPANALQAQISSLRRSLGRDAVERRGAGYVLVVSPEDIDTFRFERLVRAGREANAAGDLLEAVAHLRSALDLVRGPALADLAQYPFARDAGTWFDGLVIDAQEELLDALLAAGESREAVVLASALVRVHPMRERLHRQRILALYRSGRQADALRAYQDARTILLEELGVDPGVELKALERSMLAHDPALELASAPADVSAAAIAAEPDPGIPDRMPMVGRDSELVVLRGDLDSARSGHGRIDLLGGEPGIGKTRLVEEMSDEAHRQGVVVASGRCFDGPGVPSFWPWTLVVNQLLTSFPAAELRAALGSGAADLAQIVPEVKELIPDYVAPPPTDPESAKFRVCRAVFDLVDRVARVRPVLVVLDDLHWADPSSLDLLRFMASEMFDSRVQVIGTYRNIDPLLGGALAEALVDLGRHSIVRGIDVKGLDLAGIDQLLQSGGMTTDDNLLDRVKRRTDGNPFFVTELLRLLPTEEAREEARSAEAVASGRGIPDSVRGVILRRVAGLPLDSRSTLEVAATLGQDFDLAVLAATVHADGATLLDQLEPALDAGIVIDNAGRTTRYRFSHGLVNETIYDGMSAGTRTRTHQRIALALEEHHGDTDGPHLLAVATHWYHAVPAAEPTRGVDAAVHAAEWAQAHVAHQQAETQLRTALELIDAMPPGRDRSMLELAVQDRLSLLLIAATSYTDPEFGRVCARVRELCREVDDHTLMVPALWRLAINQFMQSDIEAGMASTKELLSSGGDNAGAARIAGSIVRALVTHQAGDQAAARVHFDRAIELCDSDDVTQLTEFVYEDPPAFVRFFSSLNWWLVGETERAEQESEEAFYIASAEGTHTWATMISQWAASTLSMFRRDPMATLECCEYGLHLAEAGGFGLGIPYMNVCKGWAIATQGDVHRGDALVVEGMTVAEGFGAVYMRPAFAAVHAEVLTLAGRHDDALAEVARGLAAADATGERWFEAELHRMRGVALRDSGAAEARASFERAREIALSQGSVAFARRAEADLAVLG
ncbi:MAG TPA: BTAD domain-containing putative transcriptional regulator [Acidimicrobiales bacterium]